jgi:hypothetical protein
MPECSGQCSGTATHTRRFVGAKCKNFGNKPRAHFITDAIEKAIIDAREDCAEGCDCIIDQKKTKEEPPGGKCEDTPNGHKWTITVTVFGDCRPLADKK